MHRQGSPGGSRRDTSPRKTRLLKMSPNGAVLNASLDIALAASVRPKVGRNYGLVRFSTSGSGSVKVASEPTSRAFLVANLALLALLRVFMQTSFESEAAYIFIECCVDLCKRARLDVRSEVFEA